MMNLTHIGRLHIYLTVKSRSSIEIFYLKLQDKENFICGIEILRIKLFIYRKW